MEDIKYIVKRSKRKTISIHIFDDGIIEVRAPLRESDERIEQVIHSKEKWIRENLKKIKEWDTVYLTVEEMEEILKKAKDVIPSRVAYIAGKEGILYDRVSVKFQKTRWGSASIKKNLNFNALLVLMPDDILDYVIIHELCHLREMNHSKEFWQKVEIMMPDYREKRAWLKEHGGEYMAKVRR